MTTATAPKETRVDTNRLRFRVQIMFGNWTYVGPMFASIEDAEWYIASWKATYECHKDDCFRVREPGKDDK